MKTRFLSFCLATFFILSGVTFASAVPASVSDSSSKITPKSASEIVALSFMKNSISENVGIVETTPFHDLSGNVTAYCVSFELGGNPSGYVLISLLNLDNPIVEFSFEGSGLAQTVREKKNVFSKTTKENIIYLGAGALFVQEDSGENLYDVVTQQEYSADEMDKAYKATTTTLHTKNDVIIANGILNWANSGIDSDSIVKITGFGNGSDYWLMDDFSSGNVCSPTCATNVLWYWGVQRDRSWVVESGDLSGSDLAEDIFATMRGLMNTVPSLGTLNVFISSAYTNFLEERGTNYNTLILTQNNYSSFTNAIDDNCPVHTMLRNESLFSTGHDVMTFGYGESTSGTDYLFVMDGWYDYGRFAHFDYFPIVKGVKVWVGTTAN